MRVASLNALTKFHNQLDEAAAPPRGLDLAPDDEVAAARHVETRQGISIALHAAEEAGQEVYISGRKVTGDPYHRRHVRPTSVGQTYLRCWDLEANDSRSFRLDGIERVEVPR